MTYNLKELLNSTESTTEINNKWVPARPEHGGGLFKLTHRIKSALLVLSGKADAVVWPEEQ